jgi:MFS family permease
MSIQRSDLKIILWAFIASFGAYFSMYAFRKPFSAATFEGLTLWGLDYKIVLVISQLIGYLLSKFIGIKVISELKNVGRARLLITLMIVAELALVGFGLTPHPYNFIFLFINGLPLGMVFGIVFSFLEGRRVTELMSLGLGVSIIFASGAVKSIGKLLLDDYGVPQFWMPAVAGIIFFPVLLLSTWMLTRLPPPTQEDIEQRSERLPMNNQERTQLIKKYALGIISLVVIYIGLTIVRDIRDNFAVEIWTSLGKPDSAKLLAKTELYVSIMVLFVIGATSLIKNNTIAFRVNIITIILGCLLLGLSTYLFQQNAISPESWIISCGFGLFVGYTIFQGIIFERMVAVLKERANAGFLMYFADSFGYLGSATILLLRNFATEAVNWVTIFTWACYITAGVNLVLGVVALVYFERRVKVG